jgi:hypothetical protein
MTRQSFRKLAANLATLIALSACLFYLSSPQVAWGSVFSWQSPQKSITHTPQQNQPLRLEKVRIAGSLALPKAGSAIQENLDAGDDWMKGLAITLKNTSDKNIVYAMVMLHFPETDSAGQPMGSPMVFGRAPKDSNDRNYKAVLKPGEEAEITLTDAEYESLQSFLRGMAFSRVSSVELLLDAVVFDDDTLWSQGMQMRRDANNPKQWRTIR